MPDDGPDNTARAIPANDETRVSIQTGGTGTDQPDTGICTLQVGQLDERGNTVKYIYSRDRDYIVYYSRLEQRSTVAEPDEGTHGGSLGRLKQFGHVRSKPKSDPACESEGVQAQLSSNPDKRSTLRRFLLPLGTERAKLQALLKDWPHRQSYDQSIATALQLALDGDGSPDAQASALQTLHDARASILTKREIAGKAQYVGFALPLAVAGMVLLVFAQHNLFKDCGQFWLGAQAGLIGAVLSMAIGIRNRTVALDMAFAGNLSDSALRLVIGAVSGGTLVLLFSTGLLPTLHTAQGLQDIASHIHFTLLLGILAGFVEQLVPSLLDTQAKSLTDNSDPKGADTKGKASAGKTG